MNTDKIFLFLRRTYFLPIVLPLIPLILYGFIYFQIRHSDELILSGQHPAALHHWKSFPLLSGRAYERIGTAELLLRGKNFAEPNFREAKTKVFFSPVPFWQEVLKTFWASARYEDGLFYTAHIEKSINEQNILRFYRAGFLAGTNQLGLAEKELMAAGHIPELAKESSLLKSEIDHRLSTGQYTFAFDRHNLPLASKSLQGTLNILYNPLRPVFRNPSGDYLARVDDRPNRQVTLTLDYRMQNAALKALEKYAGAIVLLDVQKGDILAAASSAKTPGLPVATHTMYEPGSIIKMITLAGALESRSNPEKLFPLQCDGSI
jgi:hypothetical protein